MRSGSSKGLAARLAGMVLALVLPALLTACSAQPAPIVIEWSTESEVNTAGFNVFRSDSRDGSYSQINESLIPASPDPIVGGKYSYTDVNVVAGRTYYYKLEEVEMTGNKITYDRIVEATAQAGGFLGLSNTVWWAVVIVLAAVVAGGFVLGRRPTADRTPVSETNND